MLEANRGYAAAAEARIRAIKPAADACLAVAKGRRGEPRVPFGTIVERGLIAPGTVLYDPARRHAARVRADGTLVCADATGSIHRIGAHVQGLDACNGWTFWHFQAGSELKPIDLLRQQVRAEMA